MLPKGLPRARRISRASRPALTPWRQLAARRIQPDEARFDRRPTTGLQRSDPRSRRTRKRRTEDVRITTNERAIRRAWPDNPNGRDPNRCSGIDRRGQVGGLRGLSVRAADGRADVPERVPRLLQDQNAVAGVADAHVDLSAGIERPCRKLEGGCPAGGVSECQQALLHREVAGIRWLT